MEKVTIDYNRLCLELEKQGYLKVGERLPNFRTEEEGSGQIRFV